jgi:VanZ family protein
MLSSFARSCPLDPTAMDTARLTEGAKAADAQPKRCWRRTAVYWIAALTLYWLVLFVGTHLPAQKVSGVAMANDKFVHATAYAVLTTLLCIAWRRTGGTLGLWVRLGIAAIVLAYGAIDELTQPFFGRSCDLADWIADGVGVFGAIAIDAWRHRRD